MNLKDLVLQHPELRTTSFVKLDAEGSELVVIPALKEFLREVKPTLFVSLHPMFLRFPQLMSVIYNLEDMCPQLIAIENESAQAIKDVRLIRFAEVRDGLLENAKLHYQNFDLICTFHGPWLGATSVPLLSFVSSFSLA